MDKIFVIVWHAFIGGDVNDGRPLQFMLHPFHSQAECRVEIDKAMINYDRDKLVKRNFYVDCMRFDKIPQGLPSL